MRVYWDPTCLSHDPPHEILSGRLVPYLESPDRVRRIKQSLEEDDTFQIISADDDWPDINVHILAVHSHDYLQYLETIYEEWVAVGGDKTAVFPETFRHRQLQNSLSPEFSNSSERKGNYCFDLSCPTSDTYRAAIASVKVTLCAARALAGGDSKPSNGIFALARPPGHHAQESLCGGYCFFNNAAIAARYLLQQFSTRRVAILDVDYHHGNGTQQIFYSNSEVLYVSLHAEGDYPYFTGAADERGSGDGAGYNHNFPLPAGSTTDDLYCDTLQKATDVIGIHSDIDFLVVSLGVDTYSEDPICEFLLTQGCYPRIGRIIASLAIPTLFVMEG
ncbi:Arginase/deacetylase [Lentinus brumalis]|uniref:Arginase/deacetylase n=1 Tax=Lentinus brumalis TaxID=2498619 RepID=A0A371DDG7_9APHY|nr:Arginase/deacetylase [Polyporus brumalis]